MEEESEQTKIDKLLEHVIELRKKHRQRWWERSPVKDMITHGVTVLVALSLGYAIHALTGAPVPNIEAKKEQNEADQKAVASAAPPSAPSMAYAPVEDPPTAGPLILLDETPVVTCAPVTAPKAVAKKKAPQGQGTAVAAAPHPTTYPDVPAPAAAAPAAASK